VTSEFEGGIAGSGRISPEGCLPSSKCILLLLVPEDFFFFAFRKIRFHLRLSFLAKSWLAHLRRRPVFAFESCRKYLLNFLEKNVLNFFFLKYDQSRQSFSVAAIPVLKIGSFLVDIQICKKFLTQNSNGRRRYPVSAET
jgi:hypothetical protein